MLNFSNLLKNFFLVIINFNKFLIVFSLFFCSAISCAYATKQIQEVNYFSSFRASETNVRSGPGQNYPIKYTYKVKGIPIRVISEYDNWNEIEDYEGQTGWVMQSLLTKKRMLMIYSKKPTVEMRRKNNLDARLIYRLENFVIGEYLKCEEQWCAIKINGKKGWVEKIDVFGVDSERSKLNANPVNNGAKAVEVNKNQANLELMQNPSTSTESNNNSANSLDSKKDQHVEKNLAKKDVLVNKNEVVKTSVVKNSNGKNIHKN